MELVDLSKLSAIPFKKLQESITASNGPTGHDTKLLAMLGWYDIGAVRHAIVVIFAYLRGLDGFGKIKANMHRFYIRLRKGRLILRFLRRVLRWRNRQLKILLQYWQGMERDGHAGKGQFQDKDYIWGLFMNRNFTIAAKRAVIRELYFQHKSKFVAAWTEWQQIQCTPSHPKGLLIIGAKDSKRLYMSPWKRSGRQRIKAPNKGEARQEPLFYLDMTTFFIVNCNEKKWWLDLVSRAESDMASGWTPTLSSVVVNDVVLSEETLTAIEGASKYAEIAKRNLQGVEDVILYLSGINSGISNLDLDGSPRAEDVFFNQMPAAAADDKCDALDSSRAVMSSPRNDPNFVQCITCEPNDSSSLSPVYRRKNRPLSFSSPSISENDDGVSPRAPSLSVTNNDSSLLIRHKNVGRQGSANPVIPKTPTLGNIRSTANKDNRRRPLASLRPTTPNKMEMLLLPLPNETSLSPRSPTLQSSEIWEEPALHTLRSPPNSAAKLVRSGRKTY